MDYIFLTGGNNCEHQRKCGHREAQLGVSVAPIAQAEENVYRLRRKRLPRRVQFAEPVSEGISAARIASPPLTNTHFCS
jgi:hypothetical protein